MILTIDIGNTNIVWGIFDNHKLVSSYRINSNLNSINETDFLRNYNINNVIISSVVPNLTVKVDEICKMYFNIKPLIVNYKDIPNLKYATNNPSQLGSDRICNIMASKNLYKLPAIIIDMGTATKYDVINQDGLYLGGAISPGLKLSANTLFANTALLKKTSLKFPNTVIGTDTETNIQSGIMYGAIDSINGMIKRIINETKCNNYSIILTGGLSQNITEKIDETIIINPNLTIEGLYIIYKKLITT